MNRTKAIAGFSRACGLVLLVLALSSRARAQEPTACIGNDIDELRTASAASPDNIGLRMRIVRRQLDAFLLTDNQRKAREMLEEIESQLTAIKKLGPEFTYVYRVLARQYYRRGDSDPTEYLKVLETLDQHARISELDFEMRSLKVRSLFHLAWDKDKPDPARLEEAAAYVANWLDAPTAPVWSSTLAVLGAWLLEPGFRDEILRIFEERYAKTPDNINLALSLAGCYYALGRNESAWKTVHEAESLGLIDEVTGGRHPIVEMLRQKCAEFGGDVVTYDGFDLEHLRAKVQEQPENTSFAYRLAIRLRAKGFTGEAILDRIEEKVKEKLAEDPQFDLAKLEDQKQKIRVGIEEAYREAIPMVTKTLELNPKLDAALLLLGDLYSKVGDHDAATKSLADGIARVPFFTELREKLAEVEAQRKNWSAVAVQMAEVCKLSPCAAGSWKTDVKGSILPVPVSAREKLMVEMIGMPDARAQLLDRLSAAAKEEPRNPNLRSYLAMIQYFAGNKAEATRWMLEAEALGLCGDVGLEHPLAVKIYSRQRW